MGTGKVILSKLRCFFLLLREYHQGQGPLWPITPTHAHMHKTWVWEKLSSC